MSNIIEKVNYIGHLPNQFKVAAHKDIVELDKIYVFIPIIIQSRTAYVVALNANTNRSHMSAKLSSINTVMS